jgi:hypothetical protein
MNEQNRAIYIQSQIACAMIEIEAMKAENAQRESAGQAISYGYNAFICLIERYGLHHNAILGYLQDS